MVPWLRGGAPFPPISKALHSPNGLLCAGSNHEPLRARSPAAARAPFAVSCRFPVHSSSARAVRRVSLRVPEPQAAGPA